MKMRLPLPSLLVLLLLAGCASSRPAPEPMPPVREAAAEAPPAETTEPVETAEGPAEVVASTAGRWWMLDAETDNVVGTSADRAYETILPDRAPAQTVVVAVIDSGIDIEHEDLDDNLWTNEDEIPGNDVDDDGNGYVDDVHGWNFIGGPDGRNVDADTFEATRLYAALHPTYGSMEAGDVPPEDQEEYELYLEVREAYEDKQAFYGQQYGQLQQMNAAVQQFNALLREALGTDTLTPEAVAGLEASTRELQQAQQVYLLLDQNGITPEAIADNLETIETRIEYGLNPEFDPRPVVGDDYDDLTERYYGNNDVTGPDAFHGTHVAGIIAAERNNGIGVDGIAPAVEIMVLRAVPNGDERDKDIANAIRYAVENGADIINMSFGKGFSPEKAAVDAAVRFAMDQGVLMIHAAGNDSEDLDVTPNFPSRAYADGGQADLWIEVGASTPEAGAGLPAGFSNYGRQGVDVFAPGVQILSTVPGSGYEESQGTSMAAPVVSGLAAMLMAYYPELSAADIRDIILRSAVPFTDLQVIRPGEETPTVLFGDLSVTGAVVNAPRALEMAEAESGAQN